MKVKMLVTTNYRGVKTVGNEYDIDKDVAVRWKSRRIAEIIKEEQKENEYSNMSVKELYAYCVELGIEVEQKQPRQYYYDKLAELE